MARNTVISVIAIILGLIIIAFPLVGVIASADILGLSVLLLAIFLLSNGIAEVDYNQTRGLLNIVLGIIMLVVSLGLIFNPTIFAFLTALTVLSQLVQLHHTHIILICQPTQQNCYNSA